MQRLYSDTEAKTEVMGGDTYLKRSLLWHFAFDFSNVSQTGSCISVSSLSLGEYGYGGISANDLLEKVKNTIHSRLFAENE